MTVASLGAAAAACGGSVTEVDGSAENASTADPTRSESKTYECPAAQPTSGDACPVPEAEACTYGDCMGVPTVTATCGKDGTWEVREMSCNPPPPPAACPAATPKSGESCGRPESSPCYYGDCMGTPTITATCGDDGTWEIQQMSCNPPPPPVACPAAAPKSGESCGRPESMPCSYGDCMGTPTITATCGSDGTWQTREMSCNPPPPPSGS